MAFCSGLGDYADIGIVVDADILMGTTRIVWAQYDAAPESYFLAHQNEVTELKFDEDSTTLLQGKWQFYPRQFIEQPDPELESQVVELPASFKSLTGTNATYGTFISHFKIPKNLSDNV